jgi:hypothetical protein
VAGSAISITRIGACLQHEDDGSALRLDVDRAETSPAHAINAKRRVRRESHHPLIFVVRAPVSADVKKYATASRTPERCV